MAYSRVTSHTMSETEQNRIEPLEYRDPAVLLQEGGSVKDIPAEEIDPALDRRVKWKLDLFILPLVSSVYFFGSMGRSDLGNTRIAGIEEDLSLTPGDFSNAATTFLVANLIFQLPGTLLIKELHPNRQFAGAMMMWGFLTAITVLISNSAQLLALRFLIGGAEAFVQGGTFYISFWYQYNEIATRGAIIAATSTLAGAFNGLIAYGIAKNLDGANGWRPWRWIFLIEGIAPIAFSFVVLLLLPTSPAGLRWGFSEEEKVHIKRRSARSHNSSEARLDYRKIHKILLDFHFWLFILIACGAQFCQSSFSNFLPELIHNFGYDEINAQLFTTIVYACGCVGILFFCRVADKTNARGLTMAASTVGGVIGYAILIWVRNREVRFAATCLIAFSVYPSTVLYLTWGAMNFIGYTRRGSALAFFNIFPHLFSICGNQAYRDPPYYSVGNTASLAMVIMMLLSSLALRWYLEFLNKRKRANQSSEQAIATRGESLENIGDHHPDFFYQR
ncbi:putative pantothenate transporter [Whalleya microplaca]|nr:putative pantothenate transporter [Whalleya microplaca]